MNDEVFIAMAKALNFIDPDELSMQCALRNDPGFPSPSRFVTKQTAVLGAMQCVMVHGLRRILGLSSCIAGSL